MAADSCGRGVSGGDDAAGAADAVGRVLDAADSARKADGIGRAETFVALLPGEEPMVVEIPPEDAEIDDELHHLPPEDEVEEIDGSPEEENPDEPTGILPDEENMETETLEIDDELHHLPPEDEVEEID